MASADPCPHCDGAGFKCIPLPGGDDAEPCPYCGGTGAEAEGAGASGPMTNTQNPAPAATNPVEDRRVQPARPAAGAVEVRATPLNTKEEGR